MKSATNRDKPRHIYGVPRKEDGSHGSNYEPSTGGGLTLITRPAMIKNVGTSCPPRVSNSQTTVNDDAQLISQALAGQTAAFGQLVQKYQDRLYNTLVHVAGNAEDAKDVVQEAFVQAFLKLESFQGASAFYTWLYRIAFNVAATHRRRRGAMRRPNRRRLPMANCAARKGRRKRPKGPATGWSAKNAAARCVTRFRNCPKNIAWCSYCAKWKGTATSRSPRSSTSRWARSAAACTGHGCNSASS